MGARGGNTEQQEHHYGQRLTLNPVYDTTPVWAQGRGKGYLLSVLLLDLLQVGSEVHADLVLGAQQGPQHCIGGHAHPAQGWPLELAPQVKELLVQVFQLRGDKMRGGRERVERGFHETNPSAAGRHKGWARDSPEGWLWGELTSLLVFCSFTSVSYLSSSTDSILACSFLHSSWEEKQREMLTARTHARDCSLLATLALKDLSPEDQMGSRPDGKAWLAGQLLVSTLPASS